MAATRYNPAFAVVTQPHPKDFRGANITLTFLGGLANPSAARLTGVGAA